MISKNFAKNIILTSLHTKLKFKNNNHDFFYLKKKKIKVLPVLNSSWTRSLLFSQNYSQRLKTTEFINH